MTPTTPIHRTKSPSATFLPAIRRMLTQSASAPPRFRRISLTAITSARVTDSGAGRRIQPLPVTQERLEAARVRIQVPDQLARQPAPLAARAIPLPAP